MNFTDELNALTPNSVHVVAVPPAPAPPAATSVADPHGFNNLGAPPKLPSNIVDIFGDSGNLEKVTLSGGGGEKQRAAHAAVAKQTLAGLTPQFVSEEIVSTTRAEDLPSTIAVAVFPGFMQVVPTKTLTGLSFDELCNEIAPAVPPIAPEKNNAGLFLPATLEEAALTEAAQGQYERMGQEHNGVGLARSTEHVKELTVACGDIDSPGMFSKIMNVLKKKNVATIAYSSYKYQAHDPRYDRGRIVCAVDRPVLVSEWRAFWTGFNSLCLDELDPAGIKPAQGYVPFVLPKAGAEHVRKQFGVFAIDVDAAIKLGTQSNTVAAKEVVPYTAGAAETSAFWQRLVDVEAALAVLTNEGDDEHHVWIRRACALKEELGDQHGFRVWNNWSQQFGSRYGGESSLQTQWDSINISPDREIKATLGGIISTATLRALSFLAAVAPHGKYLEGVVGGSDVTQTNNLLAHHLHFLFFVVPEKRLRKVADSIGYPIPKDTKLINIPKAIEVLVHDLDDKHTFKGKNRGRAGIMYASQDGSRISREIGAAIVEQQTHKPWQQLYQMSGRLATVEPYAGMADEFGQGGETFTIKRHFNGGDSYLDNRLNELMVLWKAGKKVSIGAMFSDVKIEKTKPVLVDQIPPQVIRGFRDYLPNLPGIPVLKQITGAPTMVGETVIDRVGFAARHGIYFTGQKNVDFAPSKVLGKNEAAAVMANLDEKVLHNFMFVDPRDEQTTPSGDVVSRAACHSLLMTTILRVGIAQIPVHAITAADYGVGKSYLVATSSVLVTGASESLVKYPSGGNRGAREAEFVKHVETKLIEGRPVIHVDNVNGYFESNAIAALTTSEKSGMRVLGKSVEVSVEGHIMFVLNGVKLEIDKDLATRVLTIGLAKNKLLGNSDKQSGNQLMSYIRKERGNLVPALISVVRGYKAALNRGEVPAIGSGLPGALKTSRFEEWDAMVRGPIHWATGIDPHDAVERSITTSPEVLELEDILNCIVVLHRRGVLGKRFKAVDVIEGLGVYGGPAGNLKELAKVAFGPDGHRAPASPRFAKALYNKHAGLLNEVLYAEEWNVTKATAVKRLGQKMSKLPSVRLRGWVVTFKGSKNGNRFTLVKE